MEHFQAGNGHTNGTLPAGRRTLVERVRVPIFISVLALGVGYAAGFAASGVGDLREEMSAASLHLEAARAETQSVEEELAVALGRAQEAEDTLASREAELVDLENDLRAREQELDDREGDIRATEQRVARSTFGDGIWQVGVDIPPGLYRSAAGGDCYWAKLSNATGNFSSIITNGGFEANQTVQIDSAWFESSGCGEWTKIG
jgi:hypothetical protein